MIIFLKRSFLPKKIHLIVTYKTIGKKIVVTKSLFPLFYLKQNELLHAIFKSVSVLVGNQKS